MKDRLTRPTACIIIREHFVARGWSEELVPASSLDIRKTVPGQVIMCIDPRIDSRVDPNFMGPTVAGGILGLVSNNSRRSFKDSLIGTIGEVRDLGYEPGIHGDFAHGDDYTNGALKGCKFAAAGIMGMLPNLKINEEELKKLISDLNISTAMFDGTSNPVGLLLNPNPDTMVVARRMKYSLSTWLYDKLKRKPEQYLPDLTTAAEMLLPPNRRKLLIPTGI